MDLSRLDTAEGRLLGVLDKLSSPDVFSRPEEMKALLAEKKRLEPVVSLYRSYLSTQKRAEEAREMAAEEGTDPDVRKWAEEEASLADRECEKILSELQSLLVPYDPEGERNVILEIRAGTGGEEAALFAADLFRMYRMYAEAHGFGTEIISANATELGGYKEISFSVTGQGAFARFKYEGGTHRVQRVPKTETQGRIQTSAVTVAVLPEAQEVEVEIRPGDIRMESCKSSGAGGQHINKTESAVRLTHVPTGIVVECQEERSQYKNRDKAMKLLLARLYRMKVQERDAGIADARRSQVGTGDRSEKIRTYNYPQNRVSDHRIDLTLYCLKSFLDGHMDEMIQALIADEAARKLKGQKNNA